MNVEFKQGSLIARLGTPHTVVVALIGKDQGDLGCITIGVDQGIVLLAGLSEQNPGDRIEQRGFSGSIRAGDTGQLKT